MAATLTGSSACGRFSRSLFRRAFTLGAVPSEVPTRLTAVADTRGWV